MSNSNNVTIYTLFPEKYSIASSTKSSPFQNTHNETEWTIVGRGKKSSKSFEKINRSHTTNYKYAVKTPSSNGGDNGSPERSQLKLYIGNLSYDTDENRLRDKFSKFGSINDIFLPVDHDTNRLRGFGFITYFLRSNAMKAITEMDNTKLDGRTIKVSEKGRFNSPVALNVKPSDASASDVVKHSGTLRCYKRNQRRKKIRAQKRALSVIKDRCKHRTVELGKEDTVMAQPDDIWTSCILPFLNPKDIISFGCCCKESKSLSETGHIWKPIFQSRFPSSGLTPVSSQEWKLAYKLSTSKVLERLRCSHTKKTFLEDVIGIGVDFTINPKTKRVDYISTSQDLLSASAFTCNKTRADVFGNQFKLFLPLYFSEEHFQRSLFLMKKTIVRLCPDKKTTVFHPSMILDVFPKVINTFVVLVSDEGLAASRKSFHGLIRIHRLFLALAHEYPSIKGEAFSKLNNFTLSEEYRLKSSCPSIGNLLPLLMIVDQKKLEWADISSACLSELRDRMVLWACKAHSQLENLNDSSPDERLKLTFAAGSVGIRLNMLIVYFLWLLCKGSTRDRASMYDAFCGSLEADGSLLSNNEAKGDVDEHSIKHQEENTVNSHLSFPKFQYQINRILSVNTWQEYFKFVHVPCPKSKLQMAQLLKNAVKNSIRKKYHKKGMNFSAIHASGTSMILAKGQQYSAQDALCRVEFHDHWSFDSPMYLDATCLMYAGKKLVSTVDYSNTSDQRGAVIHSGDVMSQSSGTHIINLDLQRIDPTVTACVFVLSAWSNATLIDVKSASVTFRDANASPDASPLCTYDLDAHDKIPHLKSIIMCKLYRADPSKGWHILAIGDSHRGSADNYGPIYEAVDKLL